MPGDTCWRREINEVAGLQELALIKTDLAQNAKPNNALSRVAEKWGKLSPASGALDLFAIKIKKLRRTRIPLSALCNYDNNNEAWSNASLSAVLLLKFASA